MITFDAGNVLLKPSQRKRLMASLRRALRLGDRLGDFTLKIRLRRAGKQFEASAEVRDKAGAFVCRARHGAWRNALRELTLALTQRLHGQRVQRLTLA